MVKSRRINRVDPAACFATYAIAYTNTSEPTALTHLALAASGAFAAY
jgi:hypothetical protein